MNIHCMRLHPEPFEQFVNGKKHWEIRIYDEKRKRIQLGDKIMFINRASTDAQIIKTVVAFTIANSFETLLTEVILKLQECTEASLTKVLLNLRQYYSPADELKYGVIAFHLH